MIPSNSTPPWALHLLAVALFLTTLVLPAQEARFFRILASGSTAITACSPSGYVTWTNSTPGLVCTVQTATTLAPGNWTDYAQVPGSNYTTTQRLFDPNPPANMALIPAGIFTMGDTLGDGLVGELPHTVYVSAFYMDQYEVTLALWNEVYNWAITNGYSFDYGAKGKTNNHPAHSMTWYDALKWCNARSEREGKTPAYYTDEGLTSRYRTGQLAPHVEWHSGYRLPTEAEWEKAARGGASGRRFPWSDTDDITHSRANYFSSTSYSYDTSSTRNHHPGFSDGGDPYASPVGYFAPNGYGLYDMTGNVWEKCWDWFAFYSSASQWDPRGPDTGSFRVVRGGSCDSTAINCRTGSRGIRVDLTDRFSDIGFRAVLPPGQ